MKTKYTSDKWHVNLHTPLEWKDKVQDYAKKHGLTVSQIVREFFRTIVKGDKDA
tara:strand:+ start:49 stop:210 length:162 start_codon:yes stop_codon:yes gene_type:complete